MTEVKKTRSELKREDIIEGAQAAFQKYGVADSSMDKIAELANVSKRTVYNHFGSKEALVAEIITNDWKKKVVVDHVTFDPSQDIKSQLTRIIAHEIELISNPEMMELVRVAMAHFLFAPESQQTQMAKILEQETSLKRWIKRAVAEGKLKPLDVDVAEEQIGGLLKARAFWPQILRQQPLLNEQEKAELVESTTGMFLSFYQS